MGDYLKRLDEIQRKPDDPYHRSRVFRKAYGERASLSSEELYKIHLPFWLIYRY